MAMLMALLRERRSGKIANSECVFEIRFRRSFLGDT